MFNGLCLLLYCRERLGKVLDSVTEEATLRDGHVEKANFVCVPFLSKVQPEMPLMDQHIGHRPGLSPHRDL